MTFAGGSCGKRNQDHILGTSEVFLQLGIFFPFYNSFRFDFSEVYSGSCRFLHKEHSLLLPQAPPTALLISTDYFLVNMVRLSNSLSRPLPVSPQTPNGSRKHLTSHLPMPSVTAVVFVYGVAFKVYPEPQLRVLTSAITSAALSILSPPRSPTLAA